MSQSLRILIVLSMMTIDSGCARQQVSSEPVTLEIGLVDCVDPRPQVCTAIYDPVCGLMVDNSYKTFASGCTACGDTNVTGYSPGACE